MYYQSVGIVCAFSGKSVSAGFSPTRLTEIVTILSLNQSKIPWKSAFSNSIHLFVNDVKVLLLYPGTPTAQNFSSFLFLFKNSLSCRRNIIRWRTICYHEYPRFIAWCTHLSIEAIPFFYLING